MLFAPVAQLESIALRRRGLRVRIAPGAPEIQPPHGGLIYAVHPAIWTRTRSTMSSREQATRSSMRNECHTADTPVSCE